MSRGRATTLACRLAVAYQTAGMRSLGGPGLSHGIEATASSSLPYILTQLLQRNTMQVDLRLLKIILSSILILMVIVPFSYAPCFMY